MPMYLVCTSCWRELEDGETCSCQESLYTQKNAELRQQLKQAEARIAELESLDVIPMPSTTEKARSMVLLGMSWLETNAPGEFLAPHILRKQAEAVDEVQDLVTMADSVYEMQRAAKDYAQRLRQQADELENQDAE